MHVPKHGVSQQRPSTQLALTQSVPAAHAWPLFCLHAPAASHDCAPRATVRVSAPTTGVHVPRLPGTAHD